MDLKTRRLLGLPQRRPGPPYVRAIWCALWLIFSRHSLFPAFLSAHIPVIRG
jgi:hypothetical protein